MSEKTAFEQAADIEADEPFASPPAHASELPSGPGRWQRDSDRDHLRLDILVVKTIHGLYWCGWRGIYCDSGMVSVLPRGNWLPLHDASEVERLTKLAGGYLEDFVESQKALAELQSKWERLRDENERLKFDEQCAEERVARRGFLNVGSPTALYEQALQETEAKLLASQSALEAAEREVARLNEPYEDTDPRVEVYQPTGYKFWNYRIPGSEVGPHRTPREAYQCALWHLNWLEANQRATAAEQRLADYEEVYKEVLASNRRLAKRLDQLLNGDKAAEQASLCDLVAQVSTLTGEMPLLERLAELEGALKPFAEDADGIDQQWDDRRNRSTLTGIKFTVGDMRRARAALAKEVQP